ncbi:fatty acid cis/trans isomerase [Aquabacterium sp. OR-4]|uniref:fatty acid cis/trans isomerase n=1 Tax=Aquabacterium sp. OR-4 TaxID=2978127 RepID=UPI0021B49A8C|nr:fatty acid cis/trans isomerase [Aquabacterium sp. OR-4]MDT7838756.1 fatty acid cis/trans isomerase [Aquabacterium sp. OR-4]
MTRRLTRPLWLALLISLLAGCATLAASALDERFGPAQPTRHDAPLPPVHSAPRYTRHIKPLFDSRCVVCHGCYDAPCQLKLTRWDGIARGLSKASVYGELRLHEAPLTRLGVDAQQASQWRGMGFDPVLNEHSPAPEHQLAASVLWRSLQLKAQHPLPTTPLLAEADFDFSLNRQASCPNLAEFDAHARRQPLAGMPYGLPGLSAAELDLVRRWLLAGAPDDAAPTLPAPITAQVAQWEALLNGDSNRQQLVGRYLYEHLFLGHLVFEGDAQRHVFRLVRSHTPPGQPIALIATRRPFDPPGTARPYYRLQWDRETLLAKTHMPYTLGAARLARWRAWFEQPAYTVATLPGYAPELASNPFKTFAALPLQSRYRFLLDDAGFFVNNFIKGPVCRGQTALDVIQDRFWVFFTDPDIGASDHAAQLVAREAELLRMPAADGSSPSLLAWRAMAQAEDALLAAKSRAMDAQFGPGRTPIDLRFVWRGDGHNANAALTIFRHFDSATVEQGLIGEPPATAWVIGYPLLERIYYLLVAGFDVYGNTAHQLHTRLAMDFLRMEGEANFLMLLPRTARLPLRDRWYRGSSDEVKNRVLGSVYRFDADSGIAYPQGLDPQQHLYALLHQRLAPVLGQRHAINPGTEPDPTARQALQQLATLRGPALQWLPEAILLRIDSTDQTPARYVSVLRNTGHLNVSTLLRESAMLAPSEHSLTVAPGFIGAYPNALLHATPDQLPALVQTIAGLTSDADYRALADRFAIRRTDARFWQASDALMAAYRRWAPGEAGVLDWGRLENR